MIFILIICIEIKATSMLIRPSDFAHLPANAVGLPTVLKGRSTVFVGLIWSLLNLLTEVIVSVSIASPKGAKQKVIKRKR